MKRVFSVLIIILTLVIAMMLTSASDMPKILNKSTYELNEQEALKNYRLINDLLKNDISNRVNNTISLDSENYSGAYIDDEGNLNIGYVGNYGGALKEMTADQIKEQKIKYHSQKYSKKELEDLINNLTANMMDDSIYSIALDEKNNKVIVELYDISNIKFRDKIKNFPSDMIEFKQKQKELDISLTATVEIRNGAKTGEGGTISFGAVDNSTGKKGFVSVGHLQYNIIGTDVTINPYGVIGTIRKSQFSGSVDASFIERKDPFLIFGNFYKAVNLMINGDTYFSSGNLLLQGQSVTAYGGNSGVQTGKILSTNFSHTVSGVTFTDMLQCNYKAVQGDSGAPVLYNYGNVSQVVKYIGGIQSASYLLDGEWVSDSYSIASKSTNVLSALNLSTYCD